MVVDDENRLYISKEAHFEIFAQHVEKLLHTGLSLLVVFGRFFIRLAVFKQKE
jgi:hypothetical protein